jgi:hypothetical protein
MMVHLAAMVAFFVDQVGQAPVVVQCVQPAPEPEWKWWLGALAPWVGPLLSGVVSIYIAWRVFHWQGEKDRRQWVLDQKRVEWKGLLQVVGSIRTILLPGVASPQDRAMQIRKSLKPTIRDLEVAAANCVFLNDFLGDQVKSKRFYSFLRDADLNAEKMDASFRNSEFLQHPNPDLTDQKREIGRLENIQERGDLTDAIAREVIDFNDWLRKEAAVSLGTLARETKSAHKEDEESA